MTMPLISIGLPVYNGDKWIEQSLNSLVKQTYSNAEIIIVDDCSTDNTQKICSQFASKYPGISFAQNEKNLGAQGNFEKVLQMSSGKYFLWACQDDFWDEKFITLLVDKLESNTGAILAGCSVRILGEGDKVIRDLHYTGKWNPEYLSPYKLLMSLLLPVNNGNWIKNNMFLHGVIRTDILKYCVSIFPGVVSHDRHFMVLLILSGKWCYVNKVLYFRRIDVGMAIKGISKDPIFQRKRNIFEPIIGLYQMFIGIIKHHDAKISIKLFSILISIVHTIVDTAHEYAVLAIHLANKALERFLPEETYLSVKQHVVKNYFRER